MKNVALPEQALDRLREDPAIAANIDHADGYTLRPPPRQTLLPTFWWG